jgi:hypothetical protein
VIYPSSLRLLHRIHTVTFRAVHIGQIFALTRIGTGAWMIDQIGGYLKRFANRAW